MRHSRRWAHRLQGGTSAAGPRMPASTILIETGDGNRPPSSRALAVSLHPCAEVSAPPITTEGHCTEAVFTTASSSKVGFSNEMGAYAFISGRGASFPSSPGTARTASSTTTSFAFGPRLRLARLEDMGGSAEWRREAWGRVAPRLAQAPLGSGCQCLPDPVSAVSPSRSA